VMISNATLLVTNVMASLSNRIFLCPQPAVTVSFPACQHIKHQLATKPKHPPE